MVLLSVLGQRVIKLERQVEDLTNRLTEYEPTKRGDEK
jgi:hypothetical protein